MGLPVGFCIQSTPLFWGGRGCALFFQKQNSNTGTVPSTDEV